jgi:hypothetical protein
VKEISQFSLEEHDGPYEKWPRRTRLLRDGRPTGAKVPGYALLRQYELPGPRYLLVVDIDCPWEEDTLVLLLDADLHLVSKIRFGIPWGFYSLHDVTVVDERTVDLALGAQGVWRVSVLDHRRWFFGSFLSAKKIGAHRCTSCRPDAAAEPNDQGGQRATLRVRRRRSWHSYMLTAYIVLDGVDLGRVGSGEEVEFNVRPGSHVLVAATWSGPWSNHLPLNLSPGETTHVEVSATGNYEAPADPGLRCSIRKPEPAR